MGQIKRSRLWPLAKSLGVVLGWGASNAAFALAGIFQGSLVPPPSLGGPLGGGGGGAAQVPFVMAPTTTFSASAVLSILQDVQGSFPALLTGKGVFFLEILGVAILASFLIESGPRALVSFLLSFMTGMLIVYFVLTLPGLNGSFLGDPNALVALGIIFTFLVFFPFPLVLGLAGTLIGVALAEKYS